MIEIIREEEWEKASERNEEKILPRDIRQIGRPDADDRIYVENKVYRFLHTPLHATLHATENAAEKTAYVLLGKFEHAVGRQCVFVESAILLEEMKFEGYLPIWTDRTWSYIYKSLKKEREDMAVVGCALDIRGQLPTMTVKLEAIHQKNFGGRRQIMLLMDTLEQEETFYSNTSGHLEKQNGFYIYYDNKHPDTQNADRPQAEKAIPFEQEIKQPESREDTPAETIGSHTGEQSAAADLTEKYQSDNSTSSREETDSFGRKLSQSGKYRERLKAKAKKRQLSSYVPSAALFALVCFMGLTAYQNHKRVNEMETALTQIDEEMTTETANETDRIKVETVSGNVEKQDATSDEPSETDLSENSFSGETAENTADEPAAVQTDAGNAEQPADVAATTDHTAEADDTSITDDAAATASITDNISGTDTASDTDDAQTTAAENTTDAATSDKEEPDAATTDTETTDAMSEAQTYLAQGYYVVQKGDNLMGICKKIYQTTAMMDKVCEVNGIENQDAIYAGQYLVLPN